MDWDRAIERNREALKRILAALVAMAGLGNGRSAIGSGQSEMELLAPTADCQLPIAVTLPRHLHRAVLRLLRPTESAARRLIVVAARGLVVTPPPPRPRKPKPKSLAPVLRGLGIAVVMSPAGFARAAAERRAAEKRAAARAGRPLVLPLLDPLRPPGPGRPRHVPAHAAPRISVPGSSTPHRLPPPPSPHDPIDATRLALRLRALARALDDLPQHALRFARWRSRAAADARGRKRRRWPLRFGRPPGQRSTGSRRPDHQVHEVLADLHWFAARALEHPDTS